MFFKKLEVNGNDFIFLEKSNIEIEDIDFSKMARDLCNRRFGIGADGLVVVFKTKEADIGIEIYNKDGSVANVCGNALISLGEYFNKNKLRVKTRSGIKNVIRENNFISVGMGKVEYNPDYKIKELEKLYNLEYICIGNKHGVIFLSKMDFENKISEIEEIIEKDDIRNKINIEVIHIVDKNKIKMRVFERGVGETLSCGSGASAALSAAIKRGKCFKGEKVKIETFGGNHVVRQNEKGEIYISARANLVFIGDYLFSDYK